MLVTKFSIDKSKRCITAWLNLRTLLSMQFFTYKVMSENSDLTHAKDCDACSLWKDVLLHNFLTYMNVFAWKFSHRNTCLHKTCHTISYVVLDRSASEMTYIVSGGALNSTHCARTTCFHAVCLLRDVFMRVFTHYKTAIYTFWLTKSCLCVTLNISPLVCHIIFHRCTRNKVPHHDFLTYEPFSLCNFWLTRTSLCANCHI